MVVATMPGDGAVMNISANAGLGADAQRLKRAISSSMSLVER